MKIRLFLKNVFFIIICVVFLSENLNAQPFTMAINTEKNGIAAITPNPASACGSNYYFSITTSAAWWKNFYLYDDGNAVTSPTWSISGENFKYVGWDPGEWGREGGGDNTTFYVLINPTAKTLTVTITPPLCGSPAVALAANTVPAANIGQGSTNNVVRSFTLTTTTADATLNTVSFNNTGNAVYSTDITNYKLYYTGTTNSFSTSTLLGTITSGTSFTGLTQSLPVGGPYYFWITADVASAASAGKTITIGAVADSDFTIASGDKSGSAAASGTQTITAPSVTISPGAAIAAANVGQNATNHIISTIAMSVADAATTVNSIAFSNTGTANYTNDITNYKLYYTSTANSFSTSTLLGTITSGTSFTGLTQSLPVGGPYYFWITADVKSTATVDNTITVSQINSENITFASGSKSGNNAAAGTQTITATEPAITLADNTIVPSETIYANTTNNIVSRFKIDVMSNTATVTVVAFTTTGDAITTTDITNFKLWHHTANTFGSATTISTITTNLEAGNHSFSGFMQSLPIGTHYFWITTDIPSGATNNRNLTVSTISSSDITIASGTKSGSASASGTQTIMKAVPKNYYFVGNNNYNWNDSNAWRVGSCGGAIDGYPSSNDNVYFTCGDNSQIVTLNGDAACASLTIDKYEQKLNLANYNLTVGGDVVIKSQNSSIYSSAGASNILHISGGFSVEGYNAQIELENYTVIIDGDLSLSGGQSKIESVQSINVGGNLTISGNNNSYVQPSGDMFINGNVRLTEQNVEIKMSSYNLTIGGTFENTTNDVKGITWTTGTVSIHGDITVISNNATVCPFNCSGTGWLELTGGISQKFTTNNNISIKRFRQSNTGFTKAGDRTLTISNTFDRNCGPEPTINAGIFSVTGETINELCGPPIIELSSSNPAIASALVGQGAQKVPIYAFTVNVTQNKATLTDLSFSTTNTSAADINKYQLWYNNTDNLESASQVGADITTDLGTGSHTFDNFTQQVNISTVGYFWITVDIVPAATVGNTIQLSAISIDNLNFSDGDAEKSGTAYDGGVQTITESATIIATPTHLTKFRYTHNYGPSLAQVFYVSAVNLLNAPNSLTVHAPTNYVVAMAQDAAFGSTATINYTESTLDSVPVYVRLKSGLPVADYNNETITFTGGGYAGSETVICDGGVGRIFYAKSDKTFNWNDASNWEIDNCGGTTGTIPTWKDSVVIVCGYDNTKITINEDVTIGGLYLERLQEVTISGENKLEIMGSMQLGIFTWVEGKGTMNVGDGTLHVHGDLTLGFNNDMTGLKWDDGSIIVGGNVNFKDGGGPAEYGLDPGSETDENISIRPGGGPGQIKEDVNPPTYAGPFIMTGENKTINVDSYPNYENKGKDLLVAVDIPNLKLESNTITKTGAGTLYITEEFDFNNNTAFQNQEGTVVVSGTIVNAESAVFYNEANLYLDVDPSSLIEIEATTIGNVVKYFTNGDQLVRDGEYYHLKIDGSGTKTLLGDIIVNGTFEFVKPGFVDLNGNNLTMNNWEDGNISPTNTNNRYIISHGGVFTINDVDNGETANFPIGFGTADDDFCGVDIKNTDGETRSFKITDICEGLYSDGTCGGTNGGTRATEHAVDITWFIESESTSADITLYWHKNKELPDFQTNAAALFHHEVFWTLQPAPGTVTNYGVDYRYKQGSVTGFSPFSVQDSESVLPIELVTFEAKAQENAVQLFWKTETETNNDYFTLHRSNDGKEFMPIAQVPGAGTSSHPNYYYYLDNSFYPGITYYQLQQTDYDGTQSNSKIIAVDVTVTTFTLETCMQNNEMQLNIYFADEATDNEIVIMNALGQIVFEEIYFYTSHAVVNLELSPGVYIITNTTTNARSYTRFLVK